MIINFILQKSLHILYNEIGKSQKTETKTIQELMAEINSDIL